MGDSWLETDGSRTEGGVVAQTRVERDPLGEMPVPAEALWGIQTERARQNFPISNLRPLPAFVDAVVWIKRAAALTHRETGRLDRRLADAIIKAAEEVLAGGHREQFVVDPYQAGAGTSHNMNTNEVLANRASELLGGTKGDYSRVHPNDHVNMAQSTNDVFPTATRLALLLGCAPLLHAVRDLAGALDRKSREFEHVLKVGRTHLQDAVPMTLGQEFSTYAVMIEEDEQRLREAMGLIREINLGATAIGTGINTDLGYARLAIQYLGHLTGLPLQPAPNMVEATQDTGAFVQLSGVLKRIAVKLSKTCNDLRQLSSGPRAGFRELNVPAVQAGSSIMPGKVNPVIPEFVNQSAFEVIGNDVTVSLAAESGQLQLNAFLPVIVHSLFESITHLTAGCRVLADRCVQGITANTEVLRESVENSISLATILTPYLGYEQASAVAHNALACGETVPQVAVREGLLDPVRLRDLLHPDRLTGRPTQRPTLPLPTPECGS